MPNRRREPVGEICLSCGSGRNSVFGFALCMLDSIKKNSPLFSAAGCFDFQFWLLIEYIDKA